MEEPRRADETRDDDLALMADLRPDAVPTTAAMEQDRARLRHAIQAEIGRRHLGEVHETMNQIRDDEPGSPDGGDRKPTVISLSASEPKPQSTRRRPMLAAAAAALVVAVGGVLVMTSGAGNDEEPSDVADGRGGGSEPSGGAAGSPASDLACGAELPLDVPVPGEYSGPVDGPSPDSGTEPADGQLVAHWVSQQGSIEVRWPSLTAPERIGSLEAAETDVGGGLTFIDVVAEDFGEGECANLTVAVAHDDDASQPGQTASALLDDLFSADEGPPVTGSATMFRAPRVTTCDTVDGGEALYLRGEVKGLGGFATAEAAAEAFLERHATSVDDTYSEEGEHNLSEESGETESYDSVLYMDGTEDGLGVSMPIERTEDGWMVTGWHASGC